MLKKLTKTKKNPKDLIGKIFYGLETKTQIHCFTQLITTSANVWAQSMGYIFF